MSTINANLLAVGDTTYAYFDNYFLALVELACVCKHVSHFHLFELVFTHIFRFKRKHIPPMYFVSRMVDADGFHFKQQGYLLPDACGHGTQLGG